MREHNTHQLPDARPFEERLLTRLDSVDARLSSTDSRLDSMETRLDAVDGRLSTLQDEVERRLQDTRPMSEAILARRDGMARKLEGVQEEMRTGFRALGRQIEILNDDFLTMRADIRDLDRRVVKLAESRS